MTLQAKPSVAFDDVTLDFVNISSILFRLEKRGKEVRFDGRC